MNNEEFNECTSHLCELENILVNSGKISKEEILKEQIKLYNKHDTLKNEKEQDAYLLDYHLYLMNKMEDLGVGYVNY